MSVSLDVLIPTYRRPGALAVTLAGLGAQTYPHFRVVISDQTEDADTTADPLVATPVRVLRARGHEVETWRHLPRRGLAEQRQFLLDRARARYAVFLDDDVLCEPEVLAKLVTTIDKEQCGFIGMPLVGLSHVDDVRPHEQHLEPWSGPVRPEVITPGGPGWERHRLHNAANAWHVQQQLGLGPDDRLVYKVAWVGGCVIYDVAKLRSVGGFTFWRQLPPAHAGEDVLAQLRVMARYGGAGVLPTGAFHQQLPTTVDDRSVDAPWALPISAQAV
jgi:glycosyltransferase involved in cell wall biosynthesis